MARPPFNHLVNEIRTALEGLEGLQDLNSGNLSSKDRESRDQVAAGAVAGFLREDETSAFGDDFGELTAALASIRAGSTAAVWQVIERYEPHIQRVVRRRLSQQLRSRYDTMDFVQMVWKSFFEEPERLHEFDHPKQLFGFLAKMAQRKVDTEMRRRTRTEKHNISKEEPLSESQPEDHRRPLDSPSQIAIARERWNQMLEDLPPRHQDIVRLRLEGLTYDQISARLSLDEKTARRVLSRLTESQF